MKWVMSQGCLLQNYGEEFEEVENRKGDGKVETEEKLKREKQK